MNEDELQDEDTLDEEDDTSEEDDTPEDDDTPPEIPEDEEPPEVVEPPEVTETVSGGAVEITEGGTYDNQTYTSTTANQNAVLINTSASVTLNNPTVTKSGAGDAGDSSSFYGTNAAVLAKGGGTTTITGGTVKTSAAGANGVFSYGGNGGQNGAAGDGTTVVISNTTINTTGDGSGGIMTTGGGVTKANGLTVTTSGRSSAAIRSDRGGGTVSVNGGSYTTDGLGSPAIYSTANIAVDNASLTSNMSEGVCIEGQNSVTLTNCVLNANNTATNGNAQFLDGVIVYQSMSGDSAQGTATFNMTGGIFNNYSGHAFHVTNTNAVINLSGVTINNASGVLLSVCDDGWSGASNVAALNASNQILSGDILVGDDSALTLNLTNGSTFAGNIGGAILNASGAVVSSAVGAVNVMLDSSSKWYLTGDAYITDFSGNAANVITNGFTVYVNNVALEGTTLTDYLAQPTTVAGGLTFSADGLAMTVDSSFASNILDLNSYPAVANVDASGVATDLIVIDNIQDNILTGGTGNDIFVYSGIGNDIVTNFENDRIVLNTPVAGVARSGSLIGIGTAYGASILLQTNSTDGAIQYSSDGQNFFSAKIADQTENTMLYSADTNFFALGQQGAIIVTGEGNNDVRLDGSTGQGFINVLNIDASTATGNNSLGGDANANIIIGGSGSNVLWGGLDLADDLLVGGVGANNFFIGKGNGNDVVTNASSTDVVSLFDTTLSDIVAAVGNESAVAIAFNTGNVVVVGSTEALSAEYMLADGSAYRYNHATQSWQEA